ncbi:MAG: hypothetical protein ACRD2I_02240 [Vicinamibacterales bacterium]
MLGFAFLLAVVTYRSHLHFRRGASIMDDLHLSVLQMSIVFSPLSYSLFEVPPGWLGDVSPPRRVLTRIVLSAPSCSCSRWRQPILRSALVGPCRSTSRPITPASSPAA